MTTDDPGLTLAQRYDREAAAYRDFWAPILRTASSVLVQELAGAPARRIVDVGTGVGSLLADLGQAFPGAFVLGVDRSFGMIALAPPGIPRAVMEAAQLGIPDQSVDLVLLVFILFHLERPVDALQEAHRVLRRGGRVGTLTWAKELESPATAIWTECLDAHGAAAADPALVIRHDPFNTPDKMESLLRAAGFSSARSWAKDLVAAIDADLLLNLRTTMGSSKPRLDSLPPQTRETCIAEALRRMDGLAGEEFLARGEVVYSVASA